LRYLFEDLALDTDRRELRRGGIPLPIEPMVFDVITYLIRNRERVVTKEDLRAAIWGGRIVSESTVSSCITAVRSAIGDNGEDQHLIRTLPRKGFRFVAPVREEEEAAPPIAPVLISTEAVPAPEPAPVDRPDDDRRRLIAMEDCPNEPAPVPAWRRRAKMSPTAIVLAAGASIGTIAATLLFFLWPGSDLSRRPSPSRPIERFDAAAVPLVSDEMRRILATYPSRPDVKALALASDGIGIADGSPNTDSAKQEALRQCSSRAKQLCQIYAVGTDVVWSTKALSLPAPTDLRVEPLDIPLLPDEIPVLSRRGRQDVAERYLKSSNPKALAFTAGVVWFVTQRENRGEAVRMAVEHCSVNLLRPCLILSVDGFLTIQIPKTRRVVRTFLPSTEADIADRDRERIAGIYQGAEWRALARGKNGTWHAVAGAPSEAAASEAAVKSCAQADGECRLYAIGNFHVAND
jgi:DNA-binding winged helix-turn-helix (wHTH) protein